MPRGSRVAREVPRGSQKGSRVAPGEAQDPPRAPLERPKVGQGSPKGRPRSPRSSQKHHQEGKMEAETLPRSILRQNLVQNHIRRRFSIDFPSIFHRNRWQQRLANRSRTASRSCVEADIDQHGEHASYPTKTNVPAMFAKKQTRQSNAKSRRNQHRKHHRKATCAEHVDATVSPPVLVPENDEK